MRLLIMSDIHCRWSMFQPGLMPPPEEVDAVIVAGDITNLGKPKGYRLSVSQDWEAAERWMGQLCERYAEHNVFWVPGNHHPTVKPVDLMRWLCRLVTPPGGLVLDPFAGSGTTGVACAAEGLQFLGMEREEQYVEIAMRRVATAYAQGRLGL